MNHNHLTLFRAVADAGGFSSAAKAVHVSQPAISAQVAELENQLGSPLFERLPRGVRLTAAGELLLGYARRLAALTQEAERAMGELRGLERGRLAVGASTTVGVYLLPEILGEFHRRYPAIGLSLEISNTEDIHRRLLDRTLDLGLTEGDPPGEPALAAEVFHEDELVAIVPPDHPLLTTAGRGGAVTLRRLCAEPLILREPGSGTRAVVEAVFARRGVRPDRVTMVLGSTEAIKRAVAAGLGVAIVSRLSVGLELAAGRLAVVPLKPPLPRRPLHRVRLRERPLGAAAAAFQALLVSASI